MSVNALEKWREQQRDYDSGEKSQPVTNPIHKYEQKPTRGNAIKAMCAQCMGCTGEHQEPGFRHDIRDCASVTCALWKFRPFQRKTL